MLICSLRDEGLQCYRDDDAAPSHVHSLRERCLLLIILDSNKRGEYSLIKAKNFERCWHFPNQAIIAF